MTRRSTGHQPHARTHFFRRRNGQAGDFAVDQRKAPTLVERELRIDLIEVFGDHELDPEMGHPLFTRIGHEDDVPVEFDTRPRDHQKNLERTCRHTLVVLRATTPQVAVFDHGGEWVHRP